jgi:hypothetical protein
MFLLFGTLLCYKALYYLAIFVKGLIRKELVLGFNLKLGCLHPLACTRLGSVFKQCCGRRKP